MSKLAVMASSSASRPEFASTSRWINGSLATLDSPGTSLGKVERTNNASAATFVGFGSAS